MMIRPSQPADRITLHFSDFDNFGLEDWLITSDGNGTEFGRYRGKTIPPSLRSDTGVVLLEFSTSNKFTISYTSSPGWGSCLPKLLMKASFGIIEGGSWEQGSSWRRWEIPAQDCTFLIEPGETVYLHFNSFDLNNGDFVHIYDGDSTSADLFGSYSGSTLPPPIASTGHSLLLHFVSQSRTSSHAKGFDAIFVTADGYPLFNSDDLCHGVGEGCYHSSDCRHCKRTTAVIRRPFGAISDRDGLYDTSLRAHYNWATPEVWVIEPAEAAEYITLHFLEI
jgi:hypothetical protein